MNLRNRKAIEPPLEATYVIAASLVVGVVILLAVVAIGQRSVGSLGTAQCKSTIELVNAEHELVDSTVGSQRGTMMNLWASGNALGRLGRGGIIDVAWDWMQGSPRAQAFADAPANALKFNFDTCIENLSETCPPMLSEPPLTADKAAECVYKRAVDTFYTLQGGKKDKNGHSIEKRNFNLYKLKIAFEKPGSVLLNGDCREYGVLPITPSGANQMRDCLEMVSTTSIGTCGTQMGNKCNVSFSRVGTGSLLLTMLSICQQKGDGSADCKCTVKPDLGYSTNNGLPIYSCGSDSSSFQPFYLFAGGITLTGDQVRQMYPNYLEENPGIRTVDLILLGNAKIAKNNIEIDTVPTGHGTVTNPDLSFGKSYICYTSLGDVNNDGIGEVHIHDCEAVTQDETQPSPYGLTNPTGAQ